MSIFYKFKIQSFAPDEKLKDRISKMYMKQLKVLMKNKQVRNIAMTGDVGIGKSTLIRNYERKYPKLFSRKKFVYLSVTNLKNDSNNPNLQSELEERLLKQLLVICKKEEIIASHYAPVPEKNIRLIPLVLTAAAVLIALWGFGYFPKLNDSTLPTYVFLALFALFGLYYIIHKICLHYKLPKIGIGGNKSGNAELEPPDSDKETLDKNKNELVYLMEGIYKKSAKVLVVEDLDRYGADVCIPIIEKLREINVLINQRIRFAHGDKEPFRFVYILKDSIFNEMHEDDSVPPSKYFDGILPIIPQLGHANSADYLTEIREWDTKYGVDEDFINSISKYIHDYRRIRAIENEFNVFSEVAEDKLSEKKLNPTELMAFCIYKHFYPAEYYEVREKPTQELAQYLITKTVSDLACKFPTYFKYKIPDVSLPDDEKKRCLFPKITINIFRCIFPDNSINKVLDTINKIGIAIFNKKTEPLPDIEEIKSTRKTLDKTGEYAIDLKLIFSMYMARYILKVQAEEEKTEITKIQKELYEESDENAKSVNGDNAKYLFALYYSSALVNFASNTNNIEKKREIAELIKTELYEKYPDALFANSYTIAFANITYHNLDTEEIEAMADIIKAEYLDKYQTAEIAENCALAFSNTTAANSSFNERKRITGRIKNELLSVEKYHTPKLAEYYATALSNTALKTGDSETIMKIAAKIKDELFSVEKFRTVEVAEIYAEVLWRATGSLSNSREIEDIAERINNELLSEKKFQTPEIAEYYANSLLNAAIKMADPDRIKDVADRINGLLENKAFQTATIVKDYAAVLGTAAYKTDFKIKIIDIADEFQEKILSNENYSITDEIEEWYLTILFFAHKKSPDGIKDHEIKSRLRAGKFEDKFRKILEKNA